MRCISEYLQEHYNTVYHVHASFFCSLQSYVPDTFLKVTHQVKKIAIEILENNLLPEIVACCFPLHLHVSLPLEFGFNLKEEFPYPLLYGFLLIGKKNM